MRTQLQNGNATFTSMVVTSPYGGIYIPFRSLKTVSLVIGSLRLFLLHLSSFTVSLVNDHLFHLDKAFNQSPLSKHILRFHGPQDVESLTKAVIMLI